MARETLRRMRRDKPQSKLSIVAIVLAVLLPPLGLVLAVIAWFRVKIDGDRFDDRLPVVAMVLSFIVVIVVVTLAALAGAALMRPLLEVLREMLWAH